MVRLPEVPGAGSSNAHMTVSLRPERVASNLCLSAVILLALAYGFDRPLYLGVLRLVSVQPWDYPFMDWEWVPSSIHCWAEGVNVYLENTCYAPVPHIKYAYSPLLLRATFLPGSPAWTNAIGLAMAVLFALSIRLLRAPGTGFAVAVMALSTVSSEAVFSLERGQVDTLVFLLAVAGVWLWARSHGARLLAYAGWTFAGLMKFYPLVLLVLAMRERRRDLILIAATVAALCALFVWGYRDELLLALRGVPGGNPFVFWIGAMNLPGGIAMLAGWPNPAPRLLWAALVLAVLLLGAGLATRGGVGTALEAMPTRERGMFLAGALLMGGCFATGESQGYRAILLILAVPGLLSMAHALRDRLARSCFRLGCLAAPFVLWQPGLKQLLYRAGLSPSIDSRASPAGIAHFVLNELAWWWLMALLLSGVIAFALRSARHLVGAPRTGALRSA